MRAPFSRLFSAVRWLWLSRCRRNGACSRFAPEPAGPWSGPADLRATSSRTIAEDTRADGVAGPPLRLLPLLPASTYVTVLSRKESAGRLREYRRTARPRAQPPPNENGPATHAAYASYPRPDRALQPYFFHASSRPRNPLCNADFATTYR